ncbi:hypothetical protein TELCIR_11424 [Teladorsagia circumcincta]|uniref:Uncharacterized protein n=1 Tax=Teladorsagia circumcincta TaxID=45464 RepID=A0A2G9U9B1_TELCI|nr:hypothetical protein TELCIR_11424 [Teladorsagia circumcincta]
MVEKTTKVATRRMREQMVLKRTAKKARMGMLSPRILMAMIVSEFPMWAPMPRRTALPR